eukprot:Rmarinus@m.17489
MHLFWVCTRKHIPRGYLGLRLRISRRYLSFVRIGDVQVNRATPKRPELSPTFYAPIKTPSQQSLSHLRWMIQKDILAQDMFLLGPPGPSRRRHALWLCEVLGREAEYLVISRDTTESDLKQRREIVNGTVIYVDQPPVRAALNGRILILDGLHRAERNVLPTLNNLLENRELPLSDGRFLVSPERWKRLLADHTEEDLIARNLVPVHPDFRVIALGVPVPPYTGFPLDPPLRSRFQCRRFDPSTLTSQFAHLQQLSSGQASINTTSLAGLSDVAADVDGGRQASLSASDLRRLVGLRHALHLVEAEVPPASRLRIPHFEETTLDDIANIVRCFPGVTLEDAVGRYYPHWGLNPEQQDQIGNVLRRLGLSPVSEDAATASRSRTRGRDDFARITAPNSFGDEPVAMLEMSVGGSSSVTHVPCGPFTRKDVDFALPEMLPSRDSVLTALLQSHALGKDICVIGASGSGKSLLVQHFARALGYDVELIQMYKDMTARDLILRRSTDARGNTVWEDGPLVSAAKSGTLAVLDGIHRAEADLVSLLAPLIQDRFLTLPDGTTLLRADRFDHLCTSVGLTRAELTHKGVHRIHPSFRIFALGNHITGKQDEWLNSDTMGLFAYHHISSIHDEELHKLLSATMDRVVSSTPVENMMGTAEDRQRALEKLIALSERLAETDKFSSVGATEELHLSVRQLVRIASQIAVDPHSLPRHVHRTLLTDFMPTALKSAFAELLSDMDVLQTAASGPPLSVSHLSRDGLDFVSIGGFVARKHTPTAPELVPWGEFYDVPHHVECMRELVQDMSRGEHALMLIGNQGTGKNKVTDRLLELLGREREYMQLHRDSTVQSLTLAPTVTDGAVVWDDSALVRACKHGRVLVVDEADKAPTEVVSVLKGLIEDGCMTLANGHVLYDPRRTASPPEDRPSIAVHPEFQMILLANRPGYPFQGNDLFRECGDVMACIALDNPPKATEMELLKEYAPDVSEEKLERVVDAFSDLRAHVGDGLISYPYSLRELVNLARHMQRFPSDPLAHTLENSFGFDLDDLDATRILQQTLHPHGLGLVGSASSLPLGTGEEGSLVGGVKVDIAPESVLPSPPRELFCWVTNPRHRSATRHLASTVREVSCERVSVSRRNVGFQVAERRTSQLSDDFWTDKRVSTFTEETHEFRLPYISETGGQTQAHSLVTLADNSLHALAGPTWALYSIDAEEVKRGGSVQAMVLDFLPDSLPMHLSRLPRVGDPTGEALLLALPSLGCIYAIDPKNTEATLLTLPASFIGGEPVDPLKSRTRLARYRSPREVPEQTGWMCDSSVCGFGAPSDVNDDSRTATPGPLFLWRRGGNQVMAIDVSFAADHNSDKSNRSNAHVSLAGSGKHVASASVLTLPGENTSLHGVRPISRSTWLLDTSEGLFLSHCDRSSTMANDGEETMDGGMAPTASNMRLLRLSGGGGAAGRGDRTSGTVPPFPLLPPLDTMASVPLPEDMLQALSSHVASASGECKGIPPATSGVALVPPSGSAAGGQPYAYFVTVHGENNSAGVPEAVRLLSVPRSLIDIADWAPSVSGAAQETSHQNLSCTHGTVACIATLPASRPIPDVANVDDTSDVSKSHALVLGGSCGAEETSTLDVVEMFRNSAIDDTSSAGVVRDIYLPVVAETLESGRSQKQDDLVLSGACIWGEGRIIALEKSGTLRAFQVDTPGLSRDLAKWRERFFTPSEAQGAAVANPADVTQALGLTLEFGTNLPEPTLITADGAPVLDNEGIIDVTSEGDVGGSSSSSITDDGSFGGGESGGDGAIGIGG